MGAKSKPMRVYGIVPEDYSGPVWYRTAHHNLTRPVVYSRFRFEKNARNEELRQLGISGQIRGRAILKPGLIVDESGALLPKWQMPSRAYVVGKRALPEVNGDGLNGLISERVHAAIVSLEPDAHLFLPYDVEHPDGRLERMYGLRFADSYLASNYIEPECLFSLARHYIETGTRENGTSYFKEPEFMSLGGTGSIDFFYLNERVVGNRHLFTSDFGGTGRSVTDFSPRLMEKLAPFGDIFCRDVDCVRIGLAPAGPALPPPETAKGNSLFGKLRTMFGGT